MTWYEDQIANRNYLAPVGFKLILDKAPKSAYLCQSANLPQISIGTPEQPTPFKRIPLAGDVSYEDLTIKFLVDEDLTNYLEIHNWLKSISAAENFDDYYNWREDYKTVGNKTIYSDGTLIIYTSNLRPKYFVKFTDMFPSSLTTLEFDAGVTDAEYFSATVNFKYNIYNITDANGTELT